MNSKALILADGEPISRALCQRLRKGRFTLALDGAAETVRKQGWLPDLIAGDFDAISPSTLRHFERRGVPILPSPDQEFTDLEKALAWCVHRDFESIWIAQGLRGRVDHAFTNLSLLRRYHAAGRELLLFRDGESVRFVRHERVTLSGRKGRRIAVLPFPKCRARSRGLAFELRNLPLEIGVRESTSNQARLARVTLEIDGDALVVEERR